MWWATVIGLSFSWHYALAAAQSELSSSGLSTAVLVCCRLLCLCAGTHCTPFGVDGCWDVLHTLGVDGAQTGSPAAVTCAPQGPAGGLRICTAVETGTWQRSDAMTPAGLRKPIQW
jgi:hypothetical protein